MRRILRFLASVSVVLGILVLVDVAVTLVWQEPVTAVIAMIQRGEINRHLLSYRTDPLTRADLRALSGMNRAERIAYLARRELHQLANGDGVGWISIPRIHDHFLVVQGTNESDLEKGPGHYASTALPGLHQTVAIAGHRTTYLEPFRHIDQLRRGDQIVLRMPYGRFVYSVQGHRIVTPTSWWITRNRGYDRVVLSACNPVFSAAQRYVVFAKLTSSPAGHGLLP
jgi:sortase A